MERQTIHFIINPISGTTRKSRIPKWIETNLDTDKYDYCISETTYAGEAAEIADKAKRDGVNIVVAVGGDGTVNEVARSIAGSDTALGIIPSGSGNGLARHLMIPLLPRRAIELINRGETHKLDYGIINGNPFFCTCGMGFDAFISHKFAEAGRRGLVTYVEQVIREGFKYRPEKYIIEDGDGNKVEYEAVLVSCANASQYGNNAYIAPQASMRDGLFDVIVIEPFDLIETPQLLVELMNKTLDKSPLIKTFRANNITVHRQSAGYIHYDGDPVMSSADVNIRLVSEGVRVIVNANANKAKRRPNAVQLAFSDIFNDISEIREEIIRQARSVQGLNKTIIDKINRL